MRGNTKRLLLLVALFAAAMPSTLAAGSAAAAVASSERASASLDLRAQLRLTSNFGGCPQPESADVCDARTGAGAVPGLGAVTESYELIWDRGPPTCSFGSDQAFGTSVSFVVAGRGEIHFALEATGCIPQGEYNVKNRQAYTITGGTGIYAGASGTGTVERNFGTSTGTVTQGRETWTGTLAVPGLEFDQTPPTLTGATNKTVRARKGKRFTRVTFRVTAQDDRDGARPVACFPHSGYAFPLGKTRVDCSASDTSANSAKASFTVTVKRRR